jgi:hypothetical protein
MQTPSEPDGGVSIQPSGGTAASLKPSSSWSWYEELIVVNPGYEKKLPTMVLCLLQGSIMISSCMAHYGGIQLLSYLTIPAREKRFYDAARIGAIEMNVDP